MRLSCLRCQVFGAVWILVHCFVKIEQTYSIPEPYQLHFKASSLIQCILARLLSQPPAGMPDSIMENYPQIRMQNLCEALP